jgi:hypothetical protein
MPDLTVRRAGVVRVDLVDLVDRVDFVDLARVVDLPAVAFLVLALAVRLADFFAADLAAAFFFFLGMVFLNTTDPLAPVEWDYRM